MTAKIYAMRFTSKVCGACDSMERSELLEKFIDQAQLVLAGTKVETRNMVCVDPEGDNSKAPFKAAWDLSEELDVQSFPTTLFFTEDGEELVRAEIDNFVSVGRRKALAKELLEAHEEALEERRVRGLVALTLKTGL